jgi:hypothetical protein
MLIYEHERTKDIIARLIALGNIIRITTITLFVVLFGALLTLLARALITELWWLGGIYGVLIGFGLGVYTSSLLTITLEWMAQSLVAQGEILAALKKDSP